MSTPVCLANAVADALSIEAIDLPLTPAKIAAHIHGAESAPPAHQLTTPIMGKSRALHGSGKARVSVPPETVWRMLLDPNTLAAIIPGAHGVEMISKTHFRADVTLGVGPVSGRYKADIQLSNLDEPRAVTLTGVVAGALGDARGSGRIALMPVESGTKITYSYDAEIGGKVASIGGRLLDGAAKVVIKQFFAALVRHAASDIVKKPGVFVRLFGRGA
jgi:2-furoyl-CoA dehydrogenase large subunit